MPKGPNGLKRPAEAVGTDVNVAKFPTGKIEKLSLNLRVGLGLAASGTRNKNAAGARGREMAESVEGSRCR